MHKSKSHLALLSLLGWAFGTLVTLTAQPAAAQGEVGEEPIPQQLPAPPGNEDALPEPAAPHPLANSGMMRTGFGGHPGLWQPGQQGFSEQQVPHQFQPGGSHHNKYPKFNPNFWKGQMTSASGQVTNFISSGTVLSAILEHDLSSRTCKNGDVFALTLQDGFVVNGRMAIPPHSKILGTVVNCVPAKMQRHGHAGSLEVSLQTLVLPDGSHMPFYGFIDQNPNHLFESPPKKRWAGVDIRDYGQSVAGMFGSFLTGPAWIHARRQRGNEFLLGKGEVLPIRLTRSLKVPEVQVAQIPISSPPQVVPPPAPANVSTLTTAPASGGAPGLADSNEIFNTPLQPMPANQLPDPF